MSIVQESALPLRGKIVLVLVTTVFTANLYVFRRYEGLNWLDSIYFLVVTISTVGFGDVVPKHNYTKAMLILLILTGLSTIAIISEITFDKLIKMRLNPNLEIPPELILEEHIIIGGYNDVVENLSMMLDDRFFNFVIIDSDPLNVKSARSLGYSAYLGEIQLPSIIEKLNLKKAICLYLYLDDDDLTIQTSILAKQISSDLLIYAETTSHLSIEFGQLIGINRTYHHERLLASAINVTMSDIQSIYLPNQDKKGSRLRIFIATGDFLLKQNITNFLLIAEMEEILTTMIIIKNTHNFTIQPEGFYVGALLVEDKTDKIQEVGSTRTQRYSKLVIGGYSSYVKHTTDHLSFELDKTIVICFDKEQELMANKDGFETIYTPREELAAVVENYIEDSDLIVNLFDNIPDSLLMNIIISNSVKNPGVIQVAKQPYEMEILRNSGADRLIFPNLLTARSMFQIMLHELGLTYSMVYQNCHYFEYQIAENDKFKGKTASQIMKYGHEVLFYSPKGSQILTYPEKKYKFVQGDNLLLIREHSFFKQFYG